MSAYSPFLVPLERFPIFKTWRQVAFFSVEPTSFAFSKLSMTAR